jgi:RecA-family ATPase
VSSAGKQALNGDEFLALPQKERQWIIEPLIPAKGIINCYGKPKTGKSFATLGMALAISNGLAEWNGFPVRTHGNVYLLQVDTPEGELYERIQCVRDAGFDVKRLFFADMTIAPYPFNILLPQHQAWLKREMERVQPVVTIIDTLREAHEGEENDSTDMKKVVNAIVAITQPSAVILVAHSKKETQHTQMGGQPDIMDESRGSGYVSGRMDTVIRFTGHGSPIDGTMTYKGRSRGADGKMKYVQDSQTGLVVKEGDEAKLDQCVLQVIREMPGASVRQQALRVKALNNTPYTTARRRIDKHLGTTSKPEDEIEEIEAA